MKHRDYWDYSERERSELTREQVAQFEAFELMRKGVLKPGEAPAEPSKVEFASKTMFALKVSIYSPTIAFETIEAAQEVLDALKAQAISYDHSLGVYTFDRDLQIETVRVATKDTANTLLAAYRKEYDSYQGEKRRHDEEVKNYNKALQGMWEDWFDCCSRALKMNRIKATFDEYVELAGSETLARAFFSKAFDLDDREAADTWFGTTVFSGQIEVEAEPENVVEVA